MKVYKPGMVKNDMAIINFNNCGGDPRQIYRIRYDAGPSEKERELYVLAYGYAAALDMFPPFYTINNHHNPKDIPSDVSEEDCRIAMDAVGGIERVADVVLALK